MKNPYLIVVAVVLAVVGVSCRDGARDQARAVADSGLRAGVPVSGGSQGADGKQYFRFETLNDDLVRMADEEYGNSKPDYSDPDNSVGTPPFQFVKRVDCDVFKADAEVEKLIKRTPETATLHTVVILRDARKDLYSFTLTSTAPDKSLVRLQHYGPLTDENPEVVNLPISRRRLKDFPVDFKTGKPLREGAGRCLFVPYPFPADQEYWMFGTDPHSSPLQGLYRNDRFRNVDELIGLIVAAVRQQENPGGAPVK